MLTQMSQFGPWLPEQRHVAVEIGCYKGDTTKDLADSFDRVICVDPWDDEYVKGKPNLSNWGDNCWIGQYEAFQKNTESVAHKLDVRRGTSDSQLPTIPDSSVDFVYVDGDHTEDAVERDAVHAHRIIKEGGVIVFHAYLWNGRQGQKGPKGAIDRFLDKHSSEYKILAKETVKVALRKVRPTFFIHTVCILRENILFLREWITFHIKVLGIDQIVIFDNSQAQRGYGQNLKISGTTKHGDDYKSITKCLSDEDIQKEIVQLEQEFPVTFIPWSPKDEHNMIRHNQFDAIRVFCDTFRHSCTYFFHIDIDEFIMCPTGLKDFVSRNSNVSRFLLSQRKFLNRFDYMKATQSRTISECTSSFSEVHSIDGQKCLIKMSDYDKETAKRDHPNSSNLHKIPVKGPTLEYPPELYFHHFNFHEHHRTDPKYPYFTPVENTTQRDLWRSLLQTYEYKDTLTM